MTLLGIDPGLGTTGFGIISLVNNIYKNLKKKYNYEITNPSSNPFQIKLSRQLLKKYKIYSVKKVIKIICNKNK